MFYVKFHMWGKHSHLYDLYNAIGNNVPKVYFNQAKKTFAALSKATEKGLVKSMHDCSDGGIAVALAEMAFSGGLGMEIFLAQVPYIKSAGIRNESILFSESNSRFIVEVERAKQKEFEKFLTGNAFGRVGCLTNKNNFKIYGLDGKICVYTDIAELKESWRAPLKW